MRQSDAFRVMYPAVALALITAQAEGQAGAGVQTRTLSKPEVEFAEPFSGLVGVRELRDGRVIISDRTEKFIALLDLARGSITKISHEGQGPGEFTLPGNVLAVPGDTTLVTDALGRKYLKIAPGGTLAADVPLPTAGGGGRAGFMMVGGGAGGMVDAQGRIYSQGSPFVMGANGGVPEPIDSVAITRWDPRSGKVDTITYMKVERPEVRSSGSPGGGQVQMTVRIGGGRGGMPFVVSPTWAVAPDGRIAIVTPEPFQVTWVSPTGQRSPAATIAYQKIRVTEAEKEAYRESMRVSPPTGTTMRNENGRMTMSQQAMPFQEPTAWPEFKHPYLASANAVVVAPGGELWIARQRTHTEKNPYYDVVGGRGELLGRVVIPERTRLLGFGQNGAVYLVRRDQDDLEYLQRHRITTARGQ